jgi:dCMP deaminase
MISDVVATRSQCLRGKLGAVIINKDHRILSTGYNNPPPGIPSCEEVGSCLIVEREGHGPSCRRTVHAEINALIHLGDKHKEAYGLYSRFAPCNPCLEQVLKFGIKDIIHREPYDVVGGERQALLEAFGATLRHVNF